LTVELSEGFVFLFVQSLGIHKPINLFPRFGVDRDAPFSATGSRVSLTAVKQTAFGFLPVMCASPAASSRLNLLTP
jgi:hypothetical protein